jgi:hypothetical protein
MSLLVEILAWASIAGGTMITAWRLVSLTVGRSIPRRSHPAAHVRPSGLAESGTRRRSWRELEAPVVLVAFGVLVLDVNDGVTKWLMFGVIVILGPLWNLGVWARSRRDRKPGPASL